MGANIQLLFKYSTGKPLKSSKSKKYRLKAKKIDKMLGGLKKSIYFYKTKSIINKNYETKLCCC
ncbi:hypothetical protein GCM10011508_19160 [Flavobacterium lutivivi]|nr:hypothetical protein GCM10011508_19160 [Flavobacterium lutivivi]